MVANKFQVWTCKSFRLIKMQWKKSQSAHGTLEHPFSEQDECYRPVKLLCTSQSSKAKTNVGFSNSPRDQIIRDSIAVIYILQSSKESFWHSRPFPDATINVDSLAKDKRSAKLQRLITNYR